MLLLVALRRRTRDRCLFLSIWDHLPRKFERKLRIRQRERERDGEPAGRIPSCERAPASDQPTLPPPAPPLFTHTILLSLTFIFFSLQVTFLSFYFSFISRFLFLVTSSLVELLVLSRHSHLSRLLAIQTRAPSNLSLPGRLVTPPTLDVTLPPPISLSKGPTTWRFCFVFFFFVTPIPLFWILIFLLDDPI
jgi:hypothetical protein